MSLINCKAELKLKWTMYCALSAAGADSVNSNSNNINFTFKGTELYVSVVALQARDNQKLSKILSKAFEKSVYWNEFKTKGNNKNTTFEFRCFLELNFVGVNRLFALVYTNEDENSKRFETLTYQKA